MKLPQWVTKYLTPDEKMMLNPRKYSYHYKSRLPHYVKRERDIIRKDFGEEFVPEEVLPKEYFDPRSFRYVRVPRDRTKPASAYILIGCPKGGWDEATQRCRVGTKAHKIMHRLSRWLQKEAERKKMIANPLLMIINHLPNKYEPLYNNPPMPPKLRQLLPKLRKTFPDIDDALAQYYEQHGQYPERIYRTKIKVGDPKRITERISLVALGEAVDETYRPTWESRKMKGQGYIHKYKNKALKVTDAYGKYIMTVPLYDKKMVKRGWIVY